MRGGSDLEAESFFSAQRQQAKGPGGVGRGEPSCPTHPAAGGVSQLAGAWRGARGVPRSC